LAGRSAPGCDGPAGCDDAISYLSAAFLTDSSSAAQPVLMRQAPNCVGHRLGKRFRAAYHWDIRRGRSVPMRSQFSMPMRRPAHQHRNRPQPRIARHGAIAAHHGKGQPVDPSRAHDDGRERLQKVLASAGIASRRECEQLILEGRVEVDHQAVTELGRRVDPQRQEIRVDGVALPRPKLVYFAVNKPAGVVSTSRDPAGRPRVIDFLPPNVPRVFAVGRLDIASEGLILVTNDGELANKLTHPRHGVEKIYHVQVAGHIAPDVLAQLRRGTYLAEGFAQAKYVRVKSRRKRSSILEMVLDEGRNREIRRLLARVGHKVQRLKRVAVGPVRLGDLPTGAARPLSRKEIQSLDRAVAAGKKRLTAAETRRKTGDQPRRIGRTSVRRHHHDRGGGRTVIG
jgi:23S rRNA pseudouridine2605 synthase